MKWNLFLIAGVGTIMMFFSFKTDDIPQYTWEYINTPTKALTNITVPNETESLQNDYNAPFMGKSFIAFKQAIALKESQGNYDMVNQFGYAGKYQFGKAALEAVGINNRREFLESPILQERAFEALLSINKHELKEEIETYSGAVFGNTEITESGILAAAHLLGANSVKKFLRNKGKISITDGFGTSIRSYIKKFGGYDTSVIVADPKAKATSKLTKQPFS